MWIYLVDLFDVRSMQSLINLRFLSEQEIADCFQVLSGILNVGNMKFASKDESADLMVSTIDSIENGKLPSVP